MTERWKMNYFRLALKDAMDLLTVFSFWWELTALWFLHFGEGPTTQRFRDWTIRRSTRINVCMNNKESKCHMHKEAAANVLLCCLHTEWNSSAGAGLAIPWRCFFFKLHTHKNMEITRLSLQGFQGSLNTLPEPRDTWPSSRHGSMGFTCCACCCLLSWRTPWN